jgi:uncharacterized protein
MGKIAIWIVVAIVVMLLVRAFKPRRSADEGGQAAGRGKGGDDAGGREQAEAKRGSELVMACAVCGVHLPASDAVFARGRGYCGPAHRDADLDAAMSLRRDTAASGDRE